MILIISAQQPKAESPVDERFGRSPWLIKINTEIDQSEVFPNPGVTQSGGAGVAAAQFVIDQKADVVISGSFGPNAANAFRAANIEMRVFSDGALTVAQIADLFRQDKLPIFD